uniref:Sulfite exporter TauE/SafE family protein n=1 Tax=Lotus japonicus TaxID=34305 RepID=I3SZ13_LOTJA|nr:unknown [Lotus japonicus]
MLRPAGTSIKAFFKGVETWKKETIIKEETVMLLESTAPCSGDEQYNLLPGSPDGGPQKKGRKHEVSILGNIYWKQFGLLSFVWLAYLLLQIAKTYTATCSTTCWMIILLQIPVSVGVFLYKAIGLYQGWSVISAKGDQAIQWKLHYLILTSACALLAGIIGGLLGIGGGFVMGPLFLELGIAPQVASATATFGMTFSASISVVQYYLLNRFPVPYALYLTLVAAIAAYRGQFIIDKLVNMFQRASLIIFTLAFTIFVSAIVLGGEGISDMIGQIQRSEYMGFEDLCKYDA